MCFFRGYKTISSESIVEDSVLVEVGFAGWISSSGIPAVDNLSFETDFASIILAGIEACLDILFGDTVAMADKISFVRFFASDSILFPCDLVSSVFVALGEGTTTFEFATAEEEFVLGGAFLEAFVGAGGRGLIFNSESGSTPAPIGLQ